MSFSAQSHPNSDLTGEIISSAQAVHRALKTGLDEKLYENALCIELAERNISFSQQQSFPVYYKDRFIGKLVPDLIVEDKVIVETKVADGFNGAHTSQLLGYLHISGIEVGLLLNFKGSSLGVKRIANLEENQSQSVKSVVNLQDPPQA